MKFTATNIDGATVVEWQPHEDERGYFARTRSNTEFADHGLCNELTECSVSSNARKGTLRGMHYQAAPHGEIKLVNCIRGRILDVIVDIRRSSPSYMKVFSIELSLEEQNALYVPPGVAHGFLTLENMSVVQYQIAGEYEPTAASGVRWDDPAFAIEWPSQPAVMSDRDRQYPDWER